MTFLIADADDWNLSSFDQLYQLLYIQKTSDNQHHSHDMTFS